MPLTNQPGGDHTAAAHLDLPLRMVAVATLATLLCIGALWFVVSPARAVSPGGVAWTRYVHGPGVSVDDLESVATDAAGNGYFAATIGTATHSTDVRLLKLTASDKQAWALKWDSPAHKNDSAVSVVVDKAAGRVYVGGISIDKAGHKRVFVLAATTGGKKLWSQIRPAPSGFQANWVNGIGLDGKGNVYVGASLNKLSNGAAGRAFVVKYARSGRWLWAASFRPRAADFSASGFAVSRAGTVAISGVSVAGGAYKDAWTALFKSSGRVKWARGYDGSAHLVDSAAAVAFGPRGSVCLTGFTQVKSPTREAALFQKYSSGGTLLWTQVLTPGVGHEYALGHTAVDSAGNVYGAGHATSPSPTGITGELLTASLTSGGTLRWMATDFQQDKTSGEAESLLLAGGRLYVGGKTTAGPGAPDTQKWIGKVISYDPANGVSDWTAQFSGAGTWGVCWVESLAAGKAGTIYVAGSAERPFGDPAMSWDGYALRIVR